MKQPSDKTGGAPTIAPVQHIKVSDIVPDPKNQKRPEGVDVLAKSIEREGLLQPIILRPNPTPKAKQPWMIVAGERRWEAHKLLKLEVIEARVRPATLNDTALDSVRKRHAENFHREDLSPIQKAKALQEMFDLKMPQDEIAKFVGAKDQSTVSNLCRLLRLPADVQNLVHKGELTAAHAKALLKWERWPAVCACIARNVIADEMSSKDLEGEELPFTQELTRAKLAFRFSTDSYDSNAWVVTDAMKSDPDWVRINGWHNYCLNAEKFEKEKPNQDKLRAARVAARKAQEKTSTSGGGGARKMSALEKKVRADKIAKNKANRAATEEAFARAIVKLKDARGVDNTALAILCDHVFGDANICVDIATAAGALGIKVSAKLENAYCGDGEAVDELKKLGAEQLIKITALAIVQTETEQARKFSSSVPQTAIALVGKMKGGTPTAVQVTVYLGNDNKARAGSATASSTSDPAEAARKAAAKHFSCPPEAVTVKCQRYGNSVEEVPSLFMATRKGGK